jgi:hypothetical protein
VLLHPQGCYSNHLSTFLPAAHSPWTGLITEAESSSKTLIPISQTTWHHIIQDQNH